MKKCNTRKNYIYYVVSKKDAESLGFDSNGCCDACWVETEIGYLIPAINCYMCRDCFYIWGEEVSKKSESDINTENINVGIYESVLNKRNKKKPMSQAECKQKHRYSSKKYNEINKEYIKAYDKEYYQEHKEELKYKSKVYRTNNRDKISEQKKEYYRTHKKTNIE